FEVFISLGKAGGSAMADAEAMGRLISLALRSGIPLMEVHRQLRGISSDRAVGLGPNKVLSVPDAVGMALEEWWRARQGVQQDLLVEAARPNLSSSSSPQQSQPPVTVPAPAPVGAANGSAAAAQEEMSFDGYVNPQAFMGTCPDCGSQLE